MKLYSRFIAEMLESPYPELEYVLDLLGKHLPLTPFKTQSLTGNVGKRIGELINNHYSHTPRGRIKPRVPQNPSPAVRRFLADHQEKDQIVSVDHQRGFVFDRKDKVLTKVMDLRHNVPILVYTRTVTEDKEGSQEIFHTAYYRVDPTSPVTRIVKSKYECRTVEEQTGHILYVSTADDVVDLRMAREDGMLIVAQFDSEKFAEFMSKAYQVYRSPAGNLGVIVEVTRKVNDKYLKRFDYIVGNLTDEEVKTFRMRRNYLTVVV